MALLWLGSIFDWGKMHETDLSRYRPAGSLGVPHIRVPRGTFTDANRIASCVNGAVHKKTQDGKVVAAKVMSKKAVYHLKSAEKCDLKGWLSGRREVLEDPLTEIGVLQKLARQPVEKRCEFLLAMHGIYQTKRSVIIMTELASGGDLMSVVQKGALPQWQVKKYMFELFTALQYLNKLNIAHRDVSLENLLVNKGTLRLMDFGGACEIKSSDGTALRYFRKVGKPYYMAPEMYIPRTTEVTAWTSGCRPGDVQFAVTETGHLIDVKLPKDFAIGERCQAQPWGYEAKKVDTFAAGACFFMMSFGVIPWQRAILQDRWFAYYYKHGWEGFIQRMHLTAELSSLSVQAMRLMMRTLQADPYERPVAASCICDRWFQQGSSDDSDGAYGQ